MNMGLVAEVGEHTVVVSIEEAAGEDNMSVAVVGTAAAGTAVVVEYEEDTEQGTAALGTAVVVEGKEVVAEQDTAPWDTAVGVYPCL